ncbi:MAG TPA: hypothetical protein VII01_08470 [Solirubrobacteraceae bacterium]
MLALQEKARQGHHALLVALSGWLAAHGWQDIDEIPGAVDLWATRRRRRVLFEAKTGDPGIARVRGALGQLLEYRYFYGKTADALCIVAEHPLAERRCRMLDSMDVGVLWQDGDIFRPGSRTATELFGDEGEGRAG